MKKKITLRALEQRIGRGLRKDNKSLHKTRSNEKAADDLGPYYIVNEETGNIIQHKMGHNGLVKIGKELDALKDWEVVEIERLP